MTTKRQIEANRRNAKKGGPKTEEGKAVSRLNARKHGIFASALTQEDDEELASIHEHLRAWYNPAGPVEGMLVEKLAHYRDKVRQAAQDRAPHRLPHFALELAQTVHQFYTNCRVLDAQDPDMSRARLALVEGSRIVLRNILGLMGLDAPEKM